MASLDWDQLTNKLCFPDTMAGMFQALFDEHHDPETNQMEWIPPSDFPIKEKGEDNQTDTKQ